MFRRFLREYLSLTRAERRGMQILGFLLLILVLTRSIIPLMVRPGMGEGRSPGVGFTAFRDSLQKLGEIAAEAGDIPPQGPSPGSGSGPHPSSPYRPGVQPFPFDPNTAGMDELLSLGLPRRTATILLNYREAGGSFRRDSDLLKVYGLHPDEFSRLLPFIRIRRPDRANSDSAGSFCFSDEGIRNKQATRTDPPPKPRPFELNRADSLQLVSVYGIGPVFARRIIRYRQLLGGFCRPEQLLEVYGLNRDQYDELMRSSYLDTTLLRKIDLNRMDAGQLRLHPYLDRYQALALAAYREQMGVYGYPSQVLENKLLPDSIYQKIRPYLEANR